MGKGSGGEASAPPPLPHMFSDLPGKRRIRLLTTRGAAMPRPQALEEAITWPRSSISCSQPEPPRPASCSRSAMRWVPIRQGKHLPQDSSAKNSIASRAASTMSRWSW